MVCMRVRDDDVFKALHAQLFDVVYDRIAVIALSAVNEHSLAAAGYQRTVALSNVDKMHLHLRVSFGLCALRRILLLRACRYSLLRLRL